MSNVKNVEAFGKLTGICTGYGGSYKPGQLNLQVSTMATLFNQARQAIDDVHATKTDFDNASNEREMKFNDMVRLCPRIMNALKASGANALTVQDAQASVRAIQGKKAPVVAVAPESASVPKVKKRIARGLDYASLADRFARLVETVSSEPNYQPNEPELSVASLENRAGDLRHQNDVVNLTVVRLNNSRKDRSALLYTQMHNIVATARSVKQYIRSAYGPFSLQSKEVGKLRFTKPMK